MSAARAGGNATTASAEARRTIVNDTITAAAVNTIVTHTIARIRASIELTWSTVNGAPSPWAAISSCLPIRNASPSETYTCRKIIRNASASLIASGPPIFAK